MQNSWSSAEDLIPEGNKFHPLCFSFSWQFSHPSSYFYNSVPLLILSPFLFTTFSRAASHACSFDRSAFVSSFVDSPPCPLCLATQSRLSLSISLFLSFLRRLSGTSSRRPPFRLFLSLPRFLYACSYTPSCWVPSLLGVCRRRRRLGRLPMSLRDFREPLF